MLKKRTLDECCVQTQRMLEKQVMLGPTAEIQAETCPFLSLSSSISPSFGSAVRTAFGILVRHDLSKVSDEKRPVQMQLTK